MRCSDPSSVPLIDANGGLESPQPAQPATTADVEPVEQAPAAAETAQPAAEMQVKPSAQSAAAETTRSAAPEAEQPTTPAVEMHLSARAAAETKQSAAKAANTAAAQSVAIEALYTTALGEQDANRTDLLVIPCTLPDGAALMHVHTHLQRGRCSDQQRDPAPETQADCAVPFDEAPRARTSRHSERARYALSLGQLAAGTQQRAGAGEAESGGVAYRCADADARPLSAIRSTGMRQRTGPTCPPTPSAEKKAQRIR